jgi:hypothetical protein
MPVRVERSIDDPIVTFIVEGILHSETIQEVKAQTTQLLAEMGTFYGVVDLQGIETSIGETIGLLESSYGPALSTDPRINFVFVGQPAHDDPKNLTGVPLFTNNEAALEYIRREIATHAPGQSDE